ncbi:hypothetical protein GCM10022243_01260 [Saccharothrix violaceirubra]|uniref:Uncharacterized protein n=1 Tax=Saccharothrix violaceirubra TaxID=413306 RepID=A0A7W7T2M5_9PSEU|nr:hypothetical protein [Saccharothrix violaceirubra]MBB4965376.1 hypothetical protein [Saccharothrix violaceirubra]
MATPIPMTDQPGPGPIRAGLRRCATAPDSSKAVADAGPRWPDADPRPGPGHRVPTSPAPAARPVLTFPAGGHRCGLYRLVCGFYECVHGHVRRIDAHIGAGAR